MDVSVLAGVGDWLVTPALRVGGVAVTRGELLGFVTGVVNVALLVRQHPLNWPVGILNVMLLLVVFLDTGLYADAGLQVVYIALGLYGWWCWLFGNEGRTQLVVGRTRRSEWFVQTVVGVAATVTLWWILDRLTDSTVPLPDAVTTVLSLLATYGQCRKKAESWFVWIAADLIYVPLYLYKGLWPTSILYVVFLGLCVAGARAWYADLRGRETTEGLAA